MHTAFSLRIKIVLACTDWSKFVEIAEVVVLPHLLLTNAGCLCDPSALKIIHILFYSPRVHVDLISNIRICVGALLLRSCYVFSLFRKGGNASSQIEFQRTGSDQYLPIDVFTCGIFNLIGLFFRLFVSM